MAEQTLHGLILPGSSLRIRRCDRGGWVTSDSGENMNRIEGRDAAFTDGEDLIAWLSETIRRSIPYQPEPDKRTR